MHLFFSLTGLWVTWTHCFRKLQVRWACLGSFCSDYLSMSFSSLSWVHEDEPDHMHTFKVPLSKAQSRSLSQTQSHWCRERLHFKTSVGNKYLIINNLIYEGNHWESRKVYLRIKCKNISVTGVCLFYVLHLDTYKDLLCLALLGRLVLLCFQRFWKGGWFVVPYRFIGALL